MSLPHPLRAWRRRRSEIAIARADALSQDLHLLGFSWIVIPLHLRVAVRGHYLWIHRAALNFVCRFAMGWGLFLVIAGYHYGHRRELGGPIFWFIFLPVIGLILTEDAPGRMRQHRLVGACVVAIRTCATASTTAGSGRRHALRQVSLAIRSVERAVFRARRGQRAAVVGRRFRQAALRQHAGRVVAVLQAAEVRLDENQEAALRELTGLLVRIAASSAGGRLGAMLPENILAQGEKPVRSYELLWRAAGVVLSLAVIGGVSVWEVPDPVAGTVIAGGLLISTVMVFGTDWRRFISFVELLRG